VSRMVAAHHGKLHVDSQPGHGTTFSVRIPLAS
jgi:signal transduction histidine kinase